ncbi:MAG: cupin domain-containing protein [Dehalococcoidia bacterium]|nr:cupin domain-containing protein [Dehalococcoidia bacterium]
MVERGAQRTREGEAKRPDYYETSNHLMAEARKRALEGKVVIKGKDMPWQQARQGRLKYYLSRAIDDTALEGWSLFVHDIRTHSGKHRHQGGLAIYVIEGWGWTVVDGERCDWEAGDLLLLPVKAYGVEHQHFNAEPGSACKRFHIST